SAGGRPAARRPRRADRPRGRLRAPRAGGRCPRRPRPCAARDARAPAGRPVRPRREADRPPDRRQPAAPGMGPMSGPMSGGAPIVVAVDGGGSKTDAVALDLDGNVVATVRGTTSSPHLIGIPASAALVDDLIESLLAVTGPRPIASANIYLS